MSFSPPEGYVPDKPDPSPIEKLKVRVKILEEDRVKVLENELVSMKLELASTKLKLDANTVELTKLIEVVSYLSSKATPGPSFVMTPGRGWDVRVRRIRSTSSDVLGMIKQGEKYYFSQIVGGWAKLCSNEYDRFLLGNSFSTSFDINTEGWCLLRSEVANDSGNYTLLEPPFLDQSFLMTPGRGWEVRVRRLRSTSSDVLGMIKQGEKYYFSQVVGGWAKLCTGEYNRFLRSPGPVPTFDINTEGWCLLRSEVANDSGNYTLLDRV